MENKSNVNRIKPAFRTTGALTGNFGRQKVKSGSGLNDVPANSRETLGNFPTEDEYYQRLVRSVPLTSDERTLTFILSEIKRIEVRRQPPGPSTKPVGAHCSISDHFVTYR